MKPAAECVSLAEVRAALDTLDALEPGQVALLGVPWDAHSSFLRGPALAPRQIRAALHSGAINLCAESGHDLGADERWRDLMEFGAQDKAGEIHPGVPEGGRALHFTLRIVARPAADGRVAFAGPFVHGVPQGRFLYLGYERIDVDHRLRRIAIARMARRVYNGRCGRSCA